MRFSLEDLEKFARWESVVPGYDRDVAYEENMAICDYILPLMVELTSSGQFAARVVEDGGLSNYFAFFVHDTRKLPDKSRQKAYTTARWPGVAVYLSLLAPYGVFGRTLSDIDPECHALAILGPDDVCNPQDADGPIEVALLELICQTPYRFLSWEDVSQQLPNNVNPHEFCLCAEPWDRVFHVLFSNSD